MVVHSKKFIIGIVSIALYAASADLYANESDSSTNLFNLSLKELLLIKVKSATKTDKSLSKVPASISVFTQAQIQRLGIETLDELLVFVPGFQVSAGVEGSGSVAFSPRGRRSDGNVSRDILLLIDGSRINEPVTTGAFEQERKIPLYNVKRVEVIRGPGSALYGSNAFLAVINIETEKEANYGLLGVGAFGQTRAEIAFSDSGNDWGYSFSGAHYQDNGEKYPAFYEFWGQFDDTQDPGERLNLSFHYYFKQFEASFRYSERTFEDFITAGAQLDEYQRQKMESEILRLAYTFDWDKDSLLVFAEQQEGVFDYLTGIYPENPQPLPSQFGIYWTDGSTAALVGGNYREVTQNRFGIEGQWQISEDHLVSYGAVSRQEKTSLNPFQGNWDVELLETSGEYVESPADNFIQRGFWIAGVRFDLLNPEQRTIRGAFLQDEWNVNQSTTLTIGARYDDYEDFGSHASLRIGLVFDYQEYYWKFLYGEAFRAPSFTETRAGIASGGISNPDLKPEIVKTSEIIFGKNEEDWNLNITLYNNQFEDMIANVLVDDVVVGITALQPQNIGDESGSGIEFEFNQKLSENWQINVGGDYLINKPEAQPVARERLFSRLNYQNGNFGINLIARYLGQVTARKADGVNFQNDLLLDDYWHFGLSGRWQFNENTIFYGKITNLFDKTSYSFSPQAGLEKGLPSRGRGFQFGVTYNFN